MASVSTAGKTLYFYDGTVWIPVGGGGAPTGASVIYSDSQPDVTDLEVGTIWVDSDAEAVGGGGGGGGNEYNNTTDISEGSNLYFTNQRAINAGSATYILQSNQQGIINSASTAAFASASAYTNAQIATIDLESIDLSATIQTASAAAVAFLVDGAPGALDTLNELAAALNDNANILNTLLTTTAASSVYLTQSSASSVYGKKITRWRKTYSFSGNETFTVTNNGSGAYVVAGVSNPTFNLVKGNTYTFVINASGHPFWIQTVSGGYSSGNVYSTGTTNLGTANGTITWVIPANAPDTLYYACQFHSSMQGTINLIDPLKISGVDDNSNNLLYAPGYELLHINGVLLATNEYTTNSSSLITLNEALLTSDIVDIVIGG